MDQANLLKEFGKETKKHSRKTLYTRLHQLQEMGKVAVQRLGLRNIVALQNLDIEKIYSEVLKQDILFYESVRMHYDSIPSDKRPGAVLSLLMLLVSNRMLAFVHSKMLGPEHATMSENIQKSYHDLVLSTVQLLLEKSAEPGFSDTIMLNFAQVSHNLRENLNSALKDNLLTPKK